MNTAKPPSAPAAPTLQRDLLAGTVVFFVALPLALGVAFASNAPPIAGILSAIIGGIVVGVLSGSHTSVSGPASALTAIVAMEIADVGSFQAFLAALVLAGLIQILLGVLRAGKIASFFPTSVIKGLLAAIGVMLILKQIPHLLGHDPDPMGDQSFMQVDGMNTFTEIAMAFSRVHNGALAISLLCLALLLLWGRVPALKKSRIPPALVVVVLGAALCWALGFLGEGWTIRPSQKVAVPVMESPGAFVNAAITTPDWGAFKNPQLYQAALIIALVASLQSLLNSRASDRLDPKQRRTPPNRGLVAQGVGNTLCGLLGAIPVTSLIVRSSVNISAGAATKASTIWHGVLMLASVALVPVLLNQIPLAALAAVLLLVGWRMTNVSVVRSMWSQGPSQFVPFAVTIVAILLIDPLIGILIGLATATGFIITNNARRPIRQIVEKHASGEVLHLELANQVSFFSRAQLEDSLRSQPRGTQILVDATHTDYIDPDVLDLIRDFRDNTAPALGVELSLKGFRDHYPELDDRILFVDYSSRELQTSLTPERVLRHFKEGNERFLSGQRLYRDLGRQVGATSDGQFPMAVVLACIDSRAPVELVLDLGLGDIFCARVAGNIAVNKLLGSMEYACAVAGAKLVVVMGHTSCGAVNAAVDLFHRDKSIAELTGCANLEILIGELQNAIDPNTIKKAGEWQSGEKAAYANEVARRNVLLTMRRIRERSSTLDKLVMEGRIAIVGGLYDIRTGKVEFFQTADSAVTPLPEELAARVDFTPPLLAGVPAS
jgi:MFS superfamily sulfate permease-like transporter/carbonic anhydrase